MRGRINQPGNPNVCATNKKNLTRPSFTLGIRGGFCEPRVAAITIAHHALNPLPRALVKSPKMGSFDFKTDVKKRGLASADRNNKATLLLTAPYSMIKSYAKGLSPRMVKLQDVS
jgi:hypothetical protein